MLHILSLDSFVSLWDDSIATLRITSRSCFVLRKHKHQHNCGSVIMFVLSIRLSLITVLVFFNQKRWWSGRRADSRNKAHLVVWVLVEVDRRHWAQRFRHAEGVGYAIGRCVSAMSLAHANVDGALTLWVKQDAWKVVCQQMITRTDSISHHRLKFLCIAMLNVKWS